MNHMQRFNIKLKTISFILVLAIFATLIPAGGLNVSYAEEPYSSFLDPDNFDLSDYPDTSEAGEILQSGRVSEYERIALEKLGKPATVENINSYRQSDVSYQKTELANAFSRDYNETSGNVGLRKVVRTFVKEADELIHVTIKGKETVCTNEHPFYSPVKGWTAACKLRAGDILVTVNGEYVVVEKIQHEILESPVKVYNFEVEGYHTYYVGDEGVLVHNDCGDTGTYRFLRKIEHGTPNEAHHIIPKRFAKYFKVNPNEMPSVSLSHDQHVKFTNAWKEIPYGSDDYDDFKILKACQKIYKDYPDLLELAELFIMGG